MSLFDFASLTHFLRRFAFGRGRPITQPVPDVTPSDVERVVRRDYPSEQFADVMTLLDECGTKEGPRVQLAALKLAKGSVGKLRPLVESAERDYRDIGLGRISRLPQDRISYSRTPHQGATPDH
jgi:hypothetical protein